MPAPGEDVRALAALYGPRGPFLTVHLALDPARGVDDALARWATLRETVPTAAVEDLDAVEDLLWSGLGRYDRGLVAVAARGEVVLHEAVPVALLDRAAVSALPDLYPLVVSRLPDVPNLVVAADPAGSRILRAAPGGLEHLWPEADSEIEGRPLARAFARHAAAENPALVMVIGAPATARSLVADIGHVLPADVTVRVVPADVEDVDQLAAAAERTLRDHRRRSVDEALSRVTGRGPGKGAGKRTAVGPREVVAALRMAQAELVVLSAAAELPAQCWVGPRPTEFGLRLDEAHGLGVRDVVTDRFDAAVVRALAATGTRVLVLDPDDPPPPGGIAAVMRY